MKFQLCFPQALIYNEETHQFEMPSNAAELTNKIRSALEQSKSQLLYKDVRGLAKTTLVDNHYTVSCLDRAQGIQWILKERLAFFLQSSCYHEYRLSKLLFQRAPHINGHKRSSKPSTSLTSNPNGVDINIQETSTASQTKQLHEEASELYLDELATQVVEQVLEDPVFLLTAQSWENNGDLTGCTDTDGNSKCKGTCHLGNQPGMDDFKEFLHGTSGGRLFNLWRDIERLKSINSERMNSFLALMRSRYLLSSSQNSLNMELLCRLGLTTSPCWTKERLCAIQPNLTESIISYWVPRYWTSQHVQGDLDCSDMKLCVGPHSASVTPCSLCPEPWLAESFYDNHPQFCPSRSQSLGCTRLAKILEALFVDPDAGWYFTHFCEQSRNQVWENAVYFWHDLQHYHELFYQDGLDPYRVQRVAQVLYSTYLRSSASRSIGIKEEIRKEVQDQLMPAFEELFDQVEDHILNILLDAWAVLVDREKKSFLQICVYEEVRSVNTWQYRELRSLCAKSKQKINQGVTSPSNTSSGIFSEGTRVLDSWSNVPPQYQGYRLGSLPCQNHEIWHLMSFLQNKDASIHQECWLDLEQYRRTPQRNKAVRQDRSSRIAKKYLNRTYFFSSHSPATEEEQNNILHLAGGLELLKLECLSRRVTVEIQYIIRCHIEKTWLPQFLVTAEFAERQKCKLKVDAKTRVSQDDSQRQPTRKEGWKSQGLWRSSSKESLLFRQLLLNPASCLQFQHFVSLKGDFLQNDVLFWLEVQRYKDLCHSHSDEATIQQKISTIIKCFINSSTPPALQIDIPLEQAQRIMEKRHKLGPYIFREAQMSVFSKLLRFWPKFQELRSSVHEGQLLKMLQDEGLKNKARLRRQRRKEEEEDERRAQEDVKRLDSGSSEDEETKNDDNRGVEKRRGENTAVKTHSGQMLFSTEPLSWSYSKYMAALKREEALLRTRSQKEASFSSYSVSSDGSVRSTGSINSHRETSQHFSRSHVKQCH
ncbi:regulator of G-protein signaling 22 [Phycodurus eques]|uniref:regulator of G-protein signaling 22 n=1 Tax=Phycodurus eques TaxID=693459 RepID=UPI002ACD5612|nr:regulator of G-protein signaling 22 [Phycodurus eques]